MLGACSARRAWPLCAAGRAGSPGRLSPAASPSAPVERAEPIVVSGTAVQHGSDQQPPPRWRTTSRGTNRARRRSPDSPWKPKRRIPPRQRGRRVRCGPLGASRGACQGRDVGSGRARGAPRRRRRRGVVQRRQLRQRVELALNKSSITTSSRRAPRTIPRGPTRRRPQVALLDRRGLGSGQEEDLRPQRALRPRWSRSLTPTVSPADPAADPGSSSLTAFVCAPGAQPAVFGLWRSGPAGGEAGDMIDHVDHPWKRSRSRSAQTMSAASSRATPPCSRARAG